MFGFGKGKIEVILNKYNFSPGEIIEGKVILKMKKSVKARGVNIRIIAEEKTRSLSKGSMRTRDTYLYDFKQPLDGAKDYSGESSYDFQIKIPENVLAQPKLGESTMGSLVKAAQILSGVTKQTNWFLIANLDIPGGFDVSKKVQINVA